MAQVLEPLIRDEENVGFREIFEIRKVNNAPLRANVARRSPSLPGLIACTMPFTLPNGTSFVAIGCSEGIWVADPKEPDFVHRVMDLKGVTEFAIIEAYSLLLILADKVLYCYTLEALNPYNEFARTSHKLTPAVVEFFRVGIWDGRLTVVYKKSELTNSIFCLLEPLLGHPPAAAADPPVADFGAGRAYWFLFYKEFYIPVDCTDFVFLKTNVVVLHPLGFEIVDLHTFTTTTVPSQDLYPKSLLKRCKGSKPLGLFLTQHGTILLCYSTFGVFVERHGEPVAAESPQVIDWHGTVYAVVPASPYVVLFKARSIEVRRGASGRLEQVLFGNGMRCAWRGRAGGLAEEDAYGDDGAGAANRLQVVMNAPHGMGAEEVAQHVYELVPAVAPPKF